jgi:PAS domain S-box-containing protein
MQVPLLDERVLNESMQELYEQAPCGYVFTLPDGTIVRVNKTFAAWIGRSQNELIARTRFQDLLTIAGKVFYENQYAPLLRLQGFVNEVAFDLVSKGGEAMPVLVSSVQRNARDGKPLVTANVVFNATDRRAYERELLLRRSEAEQLATIVRASSDAILTVSPAGEILTWNTGAEHLFGRAAADIIGGKLNDILPGFEIQLDDGGVGADIPPNPAVHVETAAIRADGACIDVSVGVTRHLGPVGELRAVSLILSDVSERRALERMQQEFLAMASHELRNPVAGIKGFAQLMRRRRTYNERSVDQIVAQAEQLDRLINDLMLASQIEADRLHLHLLTLDLVAEGRTAAEQGRAQDRRVRFDAPDELVPVRIDRQRLAQVLANLLSNAFKYSPLESEVVLRVSRHATEARIAVIDQGCGIPAEAIPHLFDRFFRVERNATQVQGLGLGLFITRRIVEAHGGRISVASEFGRGSTFTVTVPIDLDPDGVTNG